MYCIHLYTIYVYVSSLIGLQNMFYTPFILMNNVKIDSVHLDHSDYSSCKGFSGAASFAEVMWGHWSSLIIRLNKLIHWLNEVRLLTTAFWRNGFFVAILGSVFSWDSRNLEESPFECGSALLFLGEKPRIWKNVISWSWEIPPWHPGNPEIHGEMTSYLHLFVADICCFPMWSDFLCW